MAPQVHKPDQAGYWSFVSYSHRDGAWARWLHKKLEAYKPPAGLTTRRTGAAVPKRIAPVFLDRAEFGASSSIADATKLAIERSLSLVVLCSRASAASDYVNYEIEAFIELGRRDRIFLLLLDGEPNAAARGFDAALECLPRALRTQGSSAGTEPLAADLRPGKDGRTDAFFKISAGILDVPFDSLKQRDARRRRRNAAIGATTITIAGMIVGVGLRYFQLHSTWRVEQSYATHFGEDGFTAWALAPEANLAASGSKNGSVMLHSLDGNASGQLTRRHDQKILGLALSEDGSWLGSAGEDNRVLISSPNGLGRQWEVIGYYDFDVVAWEGTSHRFLTNTSDDKTPHTVLALDPKKRKRSVFAGKASATLGAVTSSRDGSVVFSGDYKGAVKAFAPTGELLAQVNIEPINKKLSDSEVGDHAYNVRALASSFDGKTVLIGLNGAGLWLWCPRMTTDPQRLSKDFGPYLSVTFANNDRSFMVGSSEGDVSFWTLTAPCGDKLAIAKQTREANGHKDRVIAMTFDMARNRYISADSNGTIAQWSTSGDLIMPGFFGHDGDVNDLALDKGGGRLASLGEDDTLRVWELATGRQKAVLDVSSMLRGSTWPASLLYSKHLDRFLIVRPGDTILSWNGKQSDAPMPSKWQAETAAISIRHGILVLANGSKLEAIDLATKRKIFSRDTAGERIERLAISPDGNRIAVADVNRTAQVWDIAGGRLILKLPPQSDRFWTLGFSPDSRTLFTSVSMQDAVAFYDLETAGTSPSFTIGGHAFGISRALWLDNDLIVTLARSGEIRFWTKSGQLLAPPSPPTSYASSQIVSDGKRLYIAGNEDGRIRVRTIPPLWDRWIWWFLGG